MKYCDITRILQLINEWKDLIIGVSSGVITALFGYYLNERNRRKAKEDNDQRYYNEKADRLIADLNVRQYALNKADTLSHIVTVLKQNNEWNSIDLLSEGNYRHFFGDLYTTILHIDKHIENKEEYILKIKNQLTNENYWITTIFILQNPPQYPEFKSLWAKFHFLDQITWLVEYYGKPSFTIPQERLHNESYEYIYTKREKFAEFLHLISVHFGEDIFNHNPILDQSYELCAIEKYKQQEYQTALSLFTKIKQPSPITLYYLEVISLYHSSIPNEQQAVIYFEQAAKLGECHAQYELANLLIFGKTINKDVQQAIYWLEKSAQQGNYHASYLLALIYLSCNEIPQDLDKAYYWAEQTDTMMPILPKHLTEKLRPYALMRRIRQLHKIGV